MNAHDCHALDFMKCCLLLVAGIVVDLEEAVIEGHWTVLANVDFMNFAGVIIEEDPSHKDEGSWRQCILIVLVHKLCAQIRTKDDVVVAFDVVVAGVRHRVGVLLAVDTFL